MIKHFALGDMVAIWDVYILISLGLISWVISINIALQWIPEDLADATLTLFQVMAWCCQATSHKSEPEMAEFQQPTFWCIMRQLRYDMSVARSDNCRLRYTSKTLFIGLK